MSDSEDVTPEQPEAYRQERAEMAKKHILELVNTGVFIAGTVEVEDNLIFNYHLVVMARLTERQDKNRPIVTAEIRTWTPIHPQAFAWGVGLDYTLCVNLHGSVSSNRRDRAMHLDINISNALSHVEHVIDERWHEMSWQPLKHLIMVMTTGRQTSSTQPPPVTITKRVVDPTHPQLLSVWAMVGKDIMQLYRQLQSEEDEAQNGAPLRRWSHDPNSHHVYCLGKRLDSLRVQALQAEALRHRL
jgi:hypothetical protein